MISPKLIIRKFGIQIIYKKHFSIKPNCEAMKLKTLNIFPENMYMR